MSSILEALKKLEEEKVARRGGVGNIAGKVTAGDRRTRQKPAWVAPAAMAAVAAVAVLTTYAAMGGFSIREKMVHATSEYAPPQQPATSTLQPLTTEVARTAAPPATKILPVPGRKAPAASAPVTSPSPAQRPAPREESPSESPHVSRHAAAEAPQLPALSVTGIAWQKDNASRVAVVSGMSAVEGSVIEGALVKEILQDRVRFSFNKKEFEVLLGSAPQ